MRSPRVVQATCANREPTLLDSRTPGRETRNEGRGQSVSRTMRLPWILLLPIALIGCAEPLTPAIVTATLTAPQETQSVDEPEPPRPVSLEARMKQIACPEAADCRILKVRSAGTGPNGETLSVATIDRGPINGEEAAREKGARADPKITATENEDSVDANFDNCVIVHHWAFILPKDAAPDVLDGFQLTDICNDGHGAAGLGEDHVIVGNNEVTISTSGGSAWRWSQSRTVSIAPALLLRSASDGYWAMGPNRQEGDFDWRTFQGTLSWWVAPCGPNGEPPDGWEELGSGYSFIDLPAVELDKAFREGTWKSDDWRACGATVDSAAKRGFVASGERGEENDAKLTVVTDDKTGIFYVEVADDAITAKDDLQVWMAQGEVDYMEHCVMTEPIAHGFHVRMSDGKVSALTSKPPLTRVQVERANGPSGTTRFRVALLDSPKSVSFVYADSDNGKAPERTIATSDFKRSKALSLGRRLELFPPVTCHSTEGVLTREMPVFSLSSP